MEKAKSLSEIVGTRPQKGQECGKCQSWTSHGGKEQGPWPVNVQKKTVLRHRRRVVAHRKKSGKQNLYRKRVSKGLSGFVVEQWASLDPFSLHVETERRGRKGGRRQREPLTEPTRVKSE